MSLRHPIKIVCLHAASAGACDEPAWPIPKAYFPFPGGLDKIAARCTRIHYGTCIKIRFHLAFGGFGPARTRAPRTANATSALPQGKECPSLALLFEDGDDEPAHPSQPGHHHDPGARGGRRQPGRCHSPVGHVQPAEAGRSGGRGLLVLTLRRPRVVSAAERASSCSSTRRRRHLVPVLQHAHAVRAGASTASCTADPTAPR